MSEQENQPLEAAPVAVPEASSSVDDSNGEYEAMLHRAKRLRITANGILVVVGGLLLFGGYVFFQAANITTRDYSAILENAKKRELELMHALDLAQEASEFNARETAKLKQELTALKAMNPPYEIPTPTSTP